MEHYFTSDPSVKSEERNITYEINQKKFVFTSDNGVFSKNHVDFATDFLVRTVLPEIRGSVLDVGCGYGVIGIVVASISNVGKVKMLDINHRALDLANRNAIQNKVDAKVEIIESNGFEQIAETEKFDTIISNPPIRAGKSVIYGIYQEASKHLKEEGHFYIVINKKHGAPSTITYLQTIFKGVEVLDKKAGFHVIKCSQKDL